MTFLEIHYQHWRYGAVCSVSFLVEEAENWQFLQIGYLDTLKHRVAFIFFIFISSFQLLQKHYIAYRTSGQGVGSCLKRSCPGLSGSWRDKSKIASLWFCEVHHLSRGWEDGGGLGSCGKVLVKHVPATYRASSDTQGQIVGTRESLNGRHRSGFWLVPENLCFSGTNQNPERRRPFGTGLVRHCPQGLFSPFFTFLRSIYIFPPV